MLVLETAPACCRPRLAPVRIRRSASCAASTPDTASSSLEQAEASQPSISGQPEPAERLAAERDTALRRVTEQRRQSRQRQQLLYKISAIAATLLFFGLAVFATYNRFFYHASDYVTFPWTEFWATMAMIGGGAVAMEMYARWAHRVLWHEFEPGWRIHASHHEPRTGPFEDNDIFAVANALPAFALTAFGFFTPSLLGGICFGFGMGVTVFGIMYMFVHDGLVHKRFPVGPIAEVPQFKRIAIAHRLHHSEKYGGVPFGMFLGPQELESVGAGAELDRLVEEMRLSERKKTRERRSAATPRR